MITGVTGTEPASPKGGSKPLVSRNFEIPQALTPLLSSPRYEVAALLAPALHPASTSPSLSCELDIPGDSFGRGQLGGAPNLRASLSYPGGIFQVPPPF